MAFGIVCTFSNMSVTLSPITPSTCHKTHAFICSGSLIVQVKIFLFLSWISLIIASPSEPASAPNGRLIQSTVSKKCVRAAEIDKPMKQSLNLGNNGFAFFK